VGALPGSDMSLVPLSLLVLLFYPVLLLADPIPVTVPTSPASTHVVRQNFLGISLELSYLDEYCEPILALVLNTHFRI